MKLRIRARGEPPYELAIRNETNGDKRFTEPSLVELARAVGGLFFARVRGAESDAELTVHGADLVAAGASLAVDVVPARDLAREMADRKATRCAALAAAARVTPSLRGTPVVMRRPESLEHWRARPVAEWPPVRVTLNERGEAILTDGNHRVAVARELGVAELRARVRLPDGGVVERVVGIGGTADGTRPLTR